MQSNNQSTERTERTSDLLQQYNNVFKRTEQIHLQHKWSSEVEDESADIPSGESDADVVEQSMVQVQKPVQSEFKNSWAIVRGNDLQNKITKGITEILKDKTERFKKVEQKYIPMVSTIN